MKKKRQLQDSECFFLGKSVGKCTTSDGQSFVLLLEACNNSPKEVLNEYAYFSSELKQMLDRAALIEAEQANTVSLSDT